MTFEFKEFESLKATFIYNRDVINNNKYINKADTEEEFKFIDATINEIEKKIQNLKKESPGYIEQMEIMYGAVQLIIKHFELQKAKVNVNENIIKCLNDTLGITQQKKPSQQELLNWQRKLNQFLNCSLIEKNPFKGFENQHIYSHIEKNKLIGFYKLNYEMQEKLFEKIELSLDKTCEYSSSFESKPSDFTNSFQSFSNLESAVNGMIKTIIANKNKSFWHELDRKEQIGLIIDVINILKKPPSIIGRNRPINISENDKMDILLGFLYLIRAKINIEYKKDFFSTETTKTLSLIGGSEVHSQINILLGLEANLEKKDYYISRAKNFLNYLLINPGIDGANDTIKLDNKLFKHIVESFTESKSENVSYNSLLLFIKTLMNLCNKITTQIHGNALANSVLSEKQRTEAESAKRTKSNNTNSGDASEIKNNPSPNTVYHTPSNSDDEPKSEEAHTSAFSLNV